MALTFALIFLGILIVGWFVLQNLNKKMKEFEKKSRKEDEMEDIESKMENIELTEDKAETIKRFRKEHRKGDDNKNQKVVDDFVDD